MMRFMESLQAGSVASRSAAGFTLIELVVTMAIIAVLTAIAYPNYTNYVNKSKVSSGEQAIASNVAAVEQYYLDNRSYPATQTITDSNNYFAYTYTQSGTPTGQAYYITATGNAPLGQYYIAANSASVRCVCLLCSSNPFSGFTDATTACPAGSTAW